MYVRQKRNASTLLLLIVALLVQPSYAGISMSEPSGNTEALAGQLLKISCALEVQEPAEYAYLFMEENSSGKWERVTQDNAVLPVESAVFCGNLNPIDACSAQWNVEALQQAQVSLRCKGIYQMGQGMEEFTSPVAIKILARPATQIQDKDRQRLLGELKSTKSVLENMLRSGSYPLGSAKEISDALITTDSVISSLEKGAISRDEAESKTADIKNFLASMTGKTIGKAAETPLIPETPAKKTSGTQSTALIAVVAAITIAAIAIRRHRHVQKEKDMPKAQNEQRIESSLSVLEKPKSIPEKQKITELRNELNKNYTDFKAGKKDILNYEKERSRLNCEIANARHNGAGKG